MAGRNLETNVMNTVLLEVGQRPDVLAWRQQSGSFRAMDNPERVVKVGLPGMADIGMVVAVTVTADMVGKTVGVAVNAEVKTSSGKLRESQHRWMDAFEMRGGLYRTVRSRDDILAAVDDAQQGRW